MKSALVLALIGSLAAPSVCFAGPERIARSWSTIRWWRPGTEVTVWTSRSAPYGRHVIAADDSAIMLLNLADPPARADVAKSLLRAAVEHPEYFPTPEGTTFVLENRVLLNSTGVFVDDQKVAEYDQVVERVTRADVENGTVSLDNGPVKQHLRQSTKVLLGVVIGITLPGLIYGLTCAATGGCR